MQIRGNDKPVPWTMAQDSEKSGPLWEEGAHRGRRGIKNRVEKDRKGSYYLIVGTTNRGSGHGLIRSLRAVRDGNNPDRLLFHTIEESIRLDNDFAMRQVWKFGDHTSGTRVRLETTKGLLSFFSISSGRRWVVPADVGQSFEKLQTGGWRKSDSQDFSSTNRKSASFNTSSREYPLPFDISCSPRASNRRSSRSCSDLS